VLHVYAITDSSHDFQATGLDEAELRAVGKEAPFAVVSEHEQLPPRLSEDDLWAHESVVEELMEGATVLPMRIDGAVADQETLQRILDERREEFEALLAGVRGAVELGVRAQLAEETTPEDAGGEDVDGGVRGSPGTAYLLTRARHQRRADDLTARVHEPLAALSRKSKRSSAALRPGLFKAAYLVDRDRVDAFRARVDVLDSELGGGIVCTGPWPPYSFSGEEST